jgi:hypothetical protein
VSGIVLDLHRFGLGIGPRLQHAVPAYCGLKVIIVSCAFQHRPEFGAETLATRGCKHVKSLECHHRVISHIAVTCARSSVGVLQDKRAPLIAFEFENLNEIVHDALWPYRSSRRATSGSAKAISYL